MDLSPFIFALSTLLGFVLYKLRSFHNYWARRNVKYVKPTLLLGNLSVVNEKSWVEHLTDLYRSFPDERYIGVYQFLKPALLIRDPDLIKRITIKDFDHFTDHMTFTTDDIDPIWNRNLFASSGDHWKRLRSILTPCFTGSRLKKWYLLVDRVAENFVRVLSNQEEEEDGIRVVELSKFTTRFSSDIIAAFAFDVQSGSLDDENDGFFAMGEKLMDLTGLRVLRFFSFSISPTLAKLFRIKIIPEYIASYFKKTIENSLENRKDSTKTGDMLHLLLESQRKSEGNSEPILLDDIVAQSVLFYLAGSDTTSSQMSFLFYELAVNVEIQERLREELSSVDRMDFETISNLEYLDMVVCECLRKWPSGILHDRQVTKPYTIEARGPEEQDLHLEEGVVIWLSTYSIHRDQRFYAEPERFDPERFSAENRSKIDPVTYMPFGLGPRNCIGSRLAILELKLLTYRLLKSFRVVPVKRTRIPMVLDKDKFALAAEGGMWLGFEKIEL